MKVVPEHNCKDIVLPYPLLERQGVHMGDNTRRVGSKRDTCSVHKREQNGWERQCCRQEGGGGGGGTYSRLVPLRGSFHCIFD